MAVGASIITAIDSYWRLMDCNQVSFLVKTATRLAQDYPNCANGDSHVLVHANFGSDAHSGATFQFTFGLGLWVALLLHVIGAEIYLRLTPAEAERLREVAYEKQLKAGFTLAGSAGLTADVWGDGF